MVDHILLDVIAAIRDGLEGALLEQQAVEERFQVDVFLGDVSFETSYSLPGEGRPPRVRADLALEWPTWSQSAYRSWSIGESLPMPPEISIEVTLRLQRLAAAPDKTLVLSALGDDAPVIDSEPLLRGALSLEERTEGGDTTPAYALDVPYHGSFKLGEPYLEEPDRLDEELAPLGRWIASALVRLADVDLPFLPAEEGGPSR
ncbi:MAG: hypothetical protein WCF24_02620 [Acidimicrobiales bacterium]